MLQIDPDTLCAIILKAREFHAKVEVVEPDPGSNPADESERSVLEDYADDPTYLELKALLEGLNEDEIADLLALLWLGRGDFELAEWDEGRAEAMRIENARAPDYLIETPLVADYLEEALSLLGHSCEDFDTGRL